MTQAPSTNGDWLRPGEEPAVADLIGDPIAALLRRRDRIEEIDVWRAVEDAQIRLRCGRLAA